MGKPHCGRDRGRLARKEREARKKSNLRASPRVAGGTPAILKRATGLPTSSEQQLQSKLQVPRIACGSNLAKRWRAEKVIRQVEVWMIEKIKDFSAELQLNALSQVCILYQRGINALITRAIQYVPTGIAKRALCR